MIEDRPFVTVIVPVYNDAGRIGQCLDALARQTYPANRYEVIIVDNGSSDETRAVAERYPVSVLVENEIASSYAARNRGIRAARGDVLAFTDSDCIPAADWIERGVVALQGNPRCGLVGGKVELFYRQPERPTAVELYQSVTAFQQRTNVEQARFAVTANLFTRREVLQTIGLFNSSLTSGGDYEWGQRVHAAGYAQLYADDVRVAHPARHSIRQLRERVVRVVGGTEAIRRMQAEADLPDFPARDIPLEFLRTLLPNLGKALRVYSDKRLSGLTNKTRVAAIMLYVVYLRMWEKWRIRITSDRLAGNSGISQSQ